jgi:hypothetical protein
MIFVAFSRGRQVAAMIEEMMMMKIIQAKKKTRWRESVRDCTHNFKVWRCKLQRGRRIQSGEEGRMSGTQCG